MPHTINQTFNVIDKGGDPSNFPLKICDRKGNLLAWIDDQGFAGGNLAGGSSSSKQIQTVRSAPHTVTSGEANTGFIDFTLNWPVPFVDLNYTCTTGVEITNSPRQGDNSVADFYLSQNGIVARVFVDAAGDVLILNAIAIHD